MVSGFHLLWLLIPTVSPFIVGGCIGPKSVLERLLSPQQKVELRRLVHTRFEGDNALQLLPVVNQFVLEKIGPVKWNEILPELVAYQSKHHECSIYAQLLPKNVYKSLLQSVWRASESGASKEDLKRLVEDYVDRALAAGVIPEPNRPQLKTATANPASGHYYRTVLANHPPVFRNNPMGRKPIFPLLDLVNFKNYLKSHR